MNTTTVLGGAKTMSGCLRWYVTAGMVRIVQEVPPFVDLATRTSKPGPDGVSYAAYTSCPWPATTLILPWFCARASMFTFAPNGTSSGTGPGPKGVGWSVARMVAG